MSIRLLSICIACLLGVGMARAADGDSIPSHWGFGVTYHPNWQIPLDKWIRAWLYDRDAFAVNAEATYSALPADSSAYDADYGYARRWASGIGADLFYGDYDDRLTYIDDYYKHKLPHSPWSVGLSACHSVFYHRFSLQMSVGYYLYREMGHRANLLEKPYYERIGLFYTLPALHDLTFGLSLNAHLTKADFSELVISYPIKL